MLQSRHWEQELLIQTSHQVQALMLQTNRHHYLVLQTQVLVQRYQRALPARELELQRVLL